MQLTARAIKRAATTPLLGSERITKESDCRALAQPLAFMNVQKSAYRCVVLNRFGLFIVIF